MRRFRPHALALLIFATSLGLTYLLWQHERHNAVLDRQANFDFNLHADISRIEQRMAAYEQVLRGAQGLLNASDDVGRAEFQIYVDSLQLGANFFGIQGVGIISMVPLAQKNAHIAAIHSLGFPEYTIKPAGRREMYTPVIQIEPFTGHNLLAFGFDPYADPVRRVAMDQARDSGAPAITGKVRLIQETGADDRHGFVMFLPIYKKGRPHDTLASRRANIIGWVHAPFRMNNLMSSLYGERATATNIKIYDGIDMSAQTLMYDAADNRSQLLDAPPEAVEYIEVAGRTWTLAISTQPGQSTPIGKDSSGLIAIAGGSLSLLLALLTWMLATGRARALALATEMTRELRESEARFRHQAQHDNLTSLPNLGLFHDRLQQALALAKRNKTRLALMFLDLDQFKPINDTLGHQVGDLLLKAVSKRLQDCVRETDTVARIGGDEFVILLPVIEDEGHALVLAEKVRHLLSQSFDLAGGYSLSISSSIGVAIYPEYGSDEMQLLKNADGAMYHAKQGGRNKVQLFQPEIVC